MRMPALRHVVVGGVGALLLVGVGTVAASSNASSPGKRMKACG